MIPEMEETVTVARGQAPGMGVEEQHNTREYLWGV